MSSSTCTRLEVRDGIAAAARLRHVAPATVTRGGITQRNTRQALFLPLAFIAMALAVLLVAVSYAAARFGNPWATTLYWAGELTLLSVAIAVIFVRRGSEPALTAAILGFNLAQYAIKVMYSPLMLKFPDELQHEQSALGILTTGHLFPTNYSLPISPLYPGLEIVTVGLVSVTGISLYLSELLVAGVAHLLLASAVLVLFRKAAGRADLAALGALVYSIGSYQAFFNSMYIYQSLALPLAVLVVIQILAIVRGEAPRVHTMLAVGLSAGVVITHHVTALLVVAVLITATVVLGCSARYRRAAARVGVVAFSSSALLVSWVLVMAPETIDYLAEPLHKLIDSFNGGLSRAAAPVTQQPPVERVFTYLVVALPLTMLISLAVLSWRRGARDRALLGATGALLQLAVISVRFTAANGQELAGRLQNFLALYVAVGLASCFGLMLARRSRRGRAAVVGALTVLFIGGITSGWPPGYERLPGSYRVAAFESAVDAHSMATSEWVRNSMSPGNRFASDFGNLALVGTLGNQFPISSGYSDLFYRTYFDPRDGAVVQRDDIQFVLVDTRLHLQYPPPDSYSYFVDDSLAGRHLTPVPLVALHKFRDIAGVACVFDDGAIQIYSTKGSRYVDPAD